MANGWFCPTCNSAVASEHVTYEERHDPRAGGCGNSVEPYIGQSDKYLVWSHEHGAWWGPNNCGYYTRLESAGRYSKDDAIKICAHARDGFSAHDAPTEIPVREADALLCLALDQEKRRPLYFSTPHPSRRGE